MIAKWFYSRGQVADTAPWVGGVLVPVTVCLSPIAHFLACAAGGRRPLLCGCRLPVVWQLSAAMWPPVFLAWNVTTLRLGFPDDTFSRGRSFGRAFRAAEGQRAGPARSAHRGAIRGALWLTDQ